MTATDDGQTERVRRATQVLLEGTHINSRRGANCPPDIGTYERVNPVPAECKVRQRISPAERWLSPVSGCLRRNARALRACSGGSRPRRTAANAWR